MQTARIRFVDGVAIPAEIRDYCPTGLYVAFAGEGTPDAAIPVLVGTAVQVEFAVGRSGLFRFDGQVAHVSPGGVGVYAPAPPDGALRALRMASDPVVRPEAGGGAPDLNPHQAQALQQECSRLVLKEYEGFSYREIAEALDIPVGTVMSRMNYARRSLKAKLEGQRVLLMEAEHV